MKLDDTLLVRAYSKRMLVELTIKEGGNTVALQQQLEETQGAIDTIKEIMTAGGQRVLREDQIRSKALDMLIAKTGRTPREIMEILSGERGAQTIKKEADKVSVVVPASHADRPSGKTRWEIIMSDFSEFCKELEIIYRPGLNENAPDGGFGPLQASDHQLRVAAVLIDDWLAGKPVRAILLKARQLGMTTILLAFWLWLQLQIPHLVVFFMIDKDSHMYEKRDLIIRWIEKLSEKFPDAPGIRSRGGKRIVLTNESKWLFESAHSPNPGTSEMCHVIHLSEKPKWPKGKSLLVDKSLLPGQPASKGTFLVDESTAQGLEDFKKKWDRVMKGQEVGDTKTRPIFLPWFLSPEYSKRPPNDAFDADGNFIFLNDDKEVCETDEFGEISLTEEQYARKYRLNVEQVYWRRVTIKNDYKGVRVDFDQEYPTTPEHAWVAFGSLFFGSACAIEAERMQQDPIVTGYLADKNGNNDAIRMLPWTEYSPTLIADRTGSLRVYEMPRKSKDPENQPVYYIGGDLAEGKQVEKQGGTDPDSSALVVKDAFGVTVATYHARTKPEEMALPAILLGIMYNNAWINIERNSVGEACWAIFKQSGYNRVYVQPGNRPYEDRAWNKTGPANRKTMLLELRNHYRRNPQAIRCKRLVHEVASFITNKDGKPEAMSGEHDDIVLAAMHAWHMILDVTGSRIEVVEKEPESAHELEFVNVLEQNGIHLDFEEVDEQWH